MKNTMTTRIIATAAALALLAGVTACGGSVDETGSQAVTVATTTDGAPQVTAPDGGAAGSGQAQQPEQSDGGNRPPGQGGGGPGGGGFADRSAASGLIAEVGDRTMEVQSGSAQTTVTWADDTTVTLASTGTAADVTVGRCVVVIGAADESADDGALTASTVQVMPKGDDGCSLGEGMGIPGGDGFPGGGGPGGGMPSGEMPSFEVPGGSAPTGEMPMPTGDLPSGGPGGGGFPGGGFGGFAAGEVTGVSGSTVSVTSAAADGSGDTQSTVTLTDDTTVSVTGSATAEDIEAGLCATVQGETDDIGAVSATSIALTQPVDGSCSSGMGFGPGRGMGGRPGQPDGTEGTTGNG